MQTVNSSTLQLIRYHNNKFEIPQESRQFLLSLNHPIAIATIVGKYRTGKSLFLNKVLLQSNTIFKVCPTINSCTKGLWLSTNIISSQDETKILVIDTQGFGATEETDNYNNKILLFAMLLSSYFIYNSVGSIDQNSLNNLNVIANLAKQLQKNNQVNQKLEEQFPSFLWLVRDFTLNLVDKTGCPIQPREYLEQALEQQKGTSDAIENKNKIRRMIKHFFKDRDCYTLVRPVETEDKLQTLNNLNDNQLRPEFIEQTIILRNKILKKIKPKKLRNRVLDGELLLQLASSYIDAVNNGSLPNFDTSYQHLLKHQQTKTIQSCIDNVQNELHVLSRKMHTPASLKLIEQQFIQKASQKIKLQNLEPETTNNSINKLQQQIHKLMSTFAHNNHNKMIHNLTTIFQEEHNEVQQFQYYGQLEEYYENLYGRVLKKLQQQNNPIDRVHLSVALYKHKNQHYLSYCTMITSQNNNQNQNLTKIINSLKQKLSSTQTQLETLQEKYQHLHHQHILQSHQHQQTLKLNQQSIDQLTYQLEISQKDEQNLLQQNQQLSSQLQQIKQQYEQASSQLDLTTKQKQQSSQQLLLAKKQLQILHNNLQSASQQLHHLKNQIDDQSLQLQQTLNRQASMQTHFKTQLTYKSNQLNNLIQQHSRAIQEINTLKQENINLAHELQMKTTIVQKQKQIYENIFESFKENSRIENTSRSQLIETNKHLAAALTHLEKRAQQAQQKQQQLKQYKKCIKNASCLQCQHCTKFFVPSIFLPHLNLCLIGPDKTSSPPSPPLLIAITQTLVKDQDHKPYTEYVVQLNNQTRTWTIIRKYKAFCDLNHALKAALPGVELSEVSYIVNPQEGSKKSLVIQQRRKTLQKYLLDLSRNPLVSSTKIWKDFIELSEESQACSPLKQNKSGKQNKQIKKSQNIDPSPQQFYKSWNERKLRSKESLIAHKYKAPQ